METKILHPSVSDPAPSSFDRLNVEIRRWIREKEWTELRDVQDRAIRLVLDSEADVIVAAGTASGKTEAAFLPLLTQLAEHPGEGRTLVYVSPLKALINDQFRRLDLLCERMEIPVIRWHGDAPQSAKKKALRNPGGVLLITPESIEALFLRRATDAARLFGSANAVLIDELHSFLQGPRGLHLYSLLRRIEAVSARRPRRIGLSATLGDFGAAREWLNATSPDSVQLVESSSDAPELQLQIKGYLEPPDVADMDDMEGEGEPDALSRIADHAFKVLRGSNNLIFGGSRRSVEALADRLRRRAESNGVPQEFFPHHGSLSKELREELELRLKDGTLPTTAVATTTLELGIDLGSVISVAQVGAPRSLASLRQRLGRSGRRSGTPSVLRIYLREKYLAFDAEPLDHLRLQTVRAVAAVRLLLERFVEPPVLDVSLASTALHQILAIITERGGATAQQLYYLLCTAGPFSALDRADFVSILRHAAQPQVELLEQAPDGTIMLGRLGEILTSKRDFYAVFQSDDEWRLVSGGRTLGTIPIVNSLGVGSLLGFAGRRWRVTAVDDRAKILEVGPHPAGKLPKFDRLINEPVHDRLSQAMRDVLRSEDLPPYLDEEALEFLEQGRAAFLEYGLGSKRMLAVGNDTHVLTWHGTETNALLAILLMSAGLECEGHDIGVSVSNATPDEVVGLLKQISACPPASDLAQFVENLRSAKYDEYIPDDALRRLWARRNEPLCSKITALLPSLIEAA